MEAILNSFLLVAASEMGDKTQLLALILAARYRQPFTIMGGILVATLLNHLAAAYLGAMVGSFIDGDILKWVLAALFIGFAVWILIPDKDEEVKASNKMGAFLTTTILFFLAEMGDKTQLATVALGARYQSVWAVTAGTTFGMMFSDGLAVVCGDRALKKISMKWIRWLSAALFCLFALGILFVNFP